MPLRRRLTGLLMLTAALLAGCATIATVTDLDGRPYHAFEMGIAADVGLVRHLRWQYGELGPYENESRRGNGRAYVLRRQPMPVPEYFEASWETDDGVRHSVRVPVRGRLPGPAAGHSVLVMITTTGATGDYVTYTPRGDQVTRFYP